MRTRGHKLFWHVVLFFFFFHQRRDELPTAGLSGGNVVVPGGGVTVVIVRGVSVVVHVTGGALVDEGSDVVDTQSITLDGNGLGQTSFKCVSLLRTPLTGAARVEAVLQANGGTIAANVAATPVTIGCRPVPDVSAIVFNSPQAGATVTDPDRVPVTILVRDFDGAPPIGGVVQVDSPNSLGLTVTADPTSTTPMSIPFSTPADSGTVTFYVLYPGDDQTAVPKGYTLSARFANALNVTKSATLTFLYARAPNNASVRITGLTREAGSPNMHEAIAGDFSATLAAGANSTDAVRLEVEVVDRNGLPAPAGREVVFSCSGLQANCQGFSGISPYRSCKESCVRGSAGLM